MDDQQNPQQADNSTVTGGAGGADTPSGASMTLAQAMGYDLDGKKPAEGGAPEKGNAQGADGGKDGQDGQKRPAWFDQLGEDIKGDEKTATTLSKFNTVSDLAKSYTELQKLLGNRIELPGKDADSATLEAFWQKAGKPKDADGYTIDGGDEVKPFKELAFKANLTDAQAKAFFSALDSIGKEAFKNQRDALRERYMGVDKALREEYGDQYDAKKALLDKGIKAWGGDEVAEALISSGAMFNVPVVKMFIKMGEAASESGSTNRATAGTKDGYVSRRDGGGFTINI